MDLTQLEKDQERDANSIAEAVKAAEQKFTAISPDLKAEIADAKRRAIREEALQQVAAKRKAMVDRAEQARAALPRHTLEAARRTARFHDDAATDATIRSARFATLSRTPTPALQAYLEDAIATNDVAAAESVRLEFMNRADRSPEIDARFQNEIAKLQLPQVAQAQRALQRTIGLTDIVNVQLAELTRGQSDPMARLAAHRAAGTRAV